MPRSACLSYETASLWHRRGGDVKEPWHLGRTIPGGLRRWCNTPVPRALVVEDEPNIRELVCLHLGIEGLECVGVGDGREAIARAAAEPFDLVVLDLMLPGADGVAVCRAIRRSGPNAGVPVLMLTARREESDAVIGLDSGADDYVTKPFSVRELMARVRALLRRPRAAFAAPEDAPGPSRVIARQGLEIDPARRRVRVDGRPVDLTSQEFALLHLLASHAGIVFSREALLARIWTDDVHVTPRSVDTLVKRVRQKIEREPGSPRLVLTVWGAGYRFADVD
jgi:DNA-binding response OmpR family regulator